MGSAERRALLVLLSLAVTGHGVRWFLSRPDDAPGEVELLATLPARSARAHLDSAQALARPLGPGERIDLDRASAAELARLPKVGPRLARTIVADREARGPFGSLDGLDRVSGIGPGLLAAIRDHARFSGQPRRAGPARSALVNLNTATAAQLDSLPGIGPARAEAIIRWRTEHGRFGAVDDLARIPGISPAIVAKLRERVVTH